MAVPFSGQCCKVLGFCQHQRQFLWQKRWKVSSFLTEEVERKSYKWFAGWPVVWVAVGGTCFSLTASGLLKKDCVTGKRERKIRKQTRITNGIKRTCFLLSVLRFQHKVHLQTPLEDPSKAYGHPQTPGPKPYYAASFCPCFQMRLWEPAPVGKITNLSYGATFFNTKKSFFNASLVNYENQSNLKSLT